MKFLFLLFLLVSVGGQIVVGSGSISYGESSTTETIIIVSFVGDSTFYLDLSERLVRADVAFLNYSPSDGYYFMEIIHKDTNTSITKSEIRPAYKTANVWTVPIGFMINDQQIMKNGKTLVGDYEIKITSEFGSITGSAIFSILESIKQAPQVTQTQASTPEPEPTLKPEEKVTICHFPPGNSTNPQTITLSENTFQSHLSHKDIFGKCPTEFISQPTTQNGDLSELIEENRKLREELERQGSQIDSLNEQDGFFDKFMTPVMNFFLSLFSGNSKFVSLAFENGSEITMFDVQNAFSDLDELHSDIKMMNAIKILGFDARDVNVLNAHDGRLLMPNSGGVQDGAKKAGERVAVYLQNNGVKNVTVSELRYAGDVYNYTAQSSLDAYNGTAPAQGQYVILSKSPSTLLNSTEPVLQPGVIVTIILDLEGNIKYGLDTQFRLATTDGNIIVHTVYHGTKSG